MAAIWAPSPPFRPRPRIRISASNSSNTPPSQAPSRSGIRGGSIRAREPSKRSDCPGPSVAGRFSAPRRSLVERLQLDDGGLVGVADPEGRALWQVLHEGPAQVGEARQEVLH